MLADGTAVLVDRGWMPPGPAAARRPSRRCRPPPTGQVTVIGRVRASESGGGAVDRRDGRLETRRIAVARLARELPYPLHGGYLLLDQQTPAADPAFQAVPVGHTNNWQNFGYVVQWWLFAGDDASFGYGWVARREARRAAGLDKPPPARRPGRGTGTERVGLTGRATAQPVTRPAWMARTASMVSASAAVLSSR